MASPEDEKSAEVIRRYLAPAMDSTGLDPGLKEWVSSLAMASLKELVERYSGRDIGAADMVAMAAASLERNQQVVHERIKSLDSGFSYACAEGCSWCCHSHLVAMPHEAVNIFQNLPGTLDAAAAARVREHCARVASAWNAGKAREVIGSYFAPCPFLKNGRCSIYAFRPIACRNWFSRSVEACRRSYDSKNTITVPQTAIVMHLKDVVYASHAALCGLAGVDGGLVSLFTALDALFQDAEGTLSRWTGGKPFPGSIGQPG
ncbi:MAG: YkgJ family cysteine cluster protein [Thermodesulfobacteriota bacterium]